MSDQSPPSEHDQLAWCVAEIERLRGALQEIADHCGTDYYLGDVGDWAREALAA